MSYELRIWDPVRHAPLPASADEALDIAERLRSVPDTPNPAFERFGRSLADGYAALTKAAGADDVTLEEFWGGDPQEQARACQAAVYELSLPVEDARRLALAVGAAGDAGLALLDDETGMCFLPDGVVYPDDSREMWAATLDELRAGPTAPGDVAPDNRTLLQQIASALFDAIGRGNNHQ